LAVVLLLPSRSYQQGCNIGFRLDDIQDGYCSEAQRAVISTFINNSIPLTIGVIAAFFNIQPYPDTVLDDFIRTVATDGSKIEIASHGLYHNASEMYNEMPLEMQIEYLATSRAYIQGNITGIPPLTTFITPFDVYGSDTPSAMTATGFSVLTSGLFNTNCPIPNQVPPYLYLRYAATSLPNDVTTPVPASTTMSDVLYQIGLCGWAVVMLHPITYTENALCLSLNQSHFQELSILFSYLQAEGCNVYLLRDLHTHLSGSNPPPANTTITTTHPTSTTHGPPATNFPPKSATVFPPTNSTNTTSTHTGAAARCLPSFWTEFPWLDSLTSIF